MKAKSLSIFTIILLLSGCTTLFPSKKQDIICEKWRRLSDTCYNYNNSIIDQWKKKSSMAQCMESRAGKQAGYENVPIHKPSYCY